MVDRIRSGRAAGRSSRRRDQDDEAILEMVEARKVLASLEEARAEMQFWADEWWALSTRSKLVRRFIAEGGCTLADLTQFMRSGQNRGCHAQRRHLRLVVHNQRRRVRLASQGPDAA